jgi:hypothetical protein
MGDKEHNNVQDIKLLLILLLMKLGSSSEEIGAALGVDSSAIRKLLRARKVRKLAFLGTKSK